MKEKRLEQRGQREHDERGKRDERDEHVAREQHDDERHAKENGSTVATEAHASKRISHRGRENTSTRTKTSEWTVESTPKARICTHESTSAPRVSTSRWLSTR